MKNILFIGLLFIGFTSFAQMPVLTQNGVLVDTSVITQKVKDSLAAHRAQLALKLQNITGLVTGAVTGAGTTASPYNIAGGGGSQTLQQVLTTGSTLTGINVINNGGFTQKSTNGKNIVDSLHINVINTPPARKNAYGFGTSITWGKGASDTSRCYFNLLCYRENWTPNNFGVPGMYMTKTTPLATLNFIDYLTTIPTKGVNDTIAIFEFGTNDVMNSANLTATNYDTAHFRTSYKQALDNALSKAWTAPFMLITLPYYGDSTVFPIGTMVRQNNFRSCIKNIANEYGIRTVDFYSVAANNPDIFYWGKKTSTIDPSHLHPSNEGHSLLAQAIIQGIGDSVYANSQKIAAKGIVEFNSIKISNDKDTANIYTAPLGYDIRTNYVQKLPYGYYLSANGQQATGKVNLNGDIVANTVTSYFRAKANRLADATAGPALEMYYDAGNNIGGIISFDETGYAYRDLLIHGSSVTIGLNAKPASPNAKVTMPDVDMTGGFMAGGTSLPNGAIGGRKFYAYGDIGGATYMGGKFFDGSTYGANSPMVIQYAGQTTIGENVSPTSNLQVGGSFANTIVNTAIDYALGIGDNTLLVDASAGNRIIYLPTAVGIKGRHYVIKKIDATANTVTINTTASQTIDGATNYVITSQWGGVSLQGNNVNWFVRNFSSGGSSYITSLTTTGTSGAAGVTSGVLNIPTYISSAGVVRYAHPAGSTGTPTLVGGSMGGNVTGVTITGNDAFMQVAITTSGAVSGSICQINYSQAWTAAPMCVISGTISGSSSAINANGISTTAMGLAGQLPTAAGTYTYTIFSGN